MQYFLLIISFLIVIPSGAVAQTSDGPSIDGMEDEDNTVSEELLERFNRLARRARAAEIDGPGAVIKIYAEAILDPEYQAYGYIHLKLAQLLKAQGRQVDAAHHFQKCMQDHRVDALDRNVICKTGYEDTTTTLEIIDAPARSKVLILEPSLFSGPFESGGRLPLGRIKLVMEVPGYFPHESAITLKGPTRWPAEMGMKRLKGPLVPDGFLSEEPADPSQESLREVAFESPPPSASGPSKLPFWIAGGLGVAVGTAGVMIGMNAVNQSKEPNQNRNALRERAVVGDIMAWSGFSVAAGAAVWYLLMPSEE